MVLLQVAGCGTDENNKGKSEIMPEKDIKLVMESHVDELMAIPGVAGVAIGALEDGSPCIIVLVAEDTPELRGKIPSELEAYPVVVDVTGEIRALSDEE